MRPFLNSFILLFVSLVLLVSCSTRKPPEPVVIENTKTVTQVVKDTVFQVEADSSFYQAWIQCVNGKPQIINNQKQADIYNRQNPGSNATAPVKQNGKNVSAPNINLDQNGKLTADCHQEALNLFKSWKETYIKENTKKTESVYIEKPFKWFHKVLMWIGGFALLMGALGVVLKFVKPF